MKYPTLALIVYGLSLLPIVSQAQGDSSVDFNVLMMESTCEITGESSSGSGILVGIPVPFENNLVFTTLVTAHHVLDGMKIDQVSLDVRKVIDRKKQKYERLQIRIEIRKDGVPLWSKHPEVDLAALLVKLPPGCQVVPSSFLVDDKRIERYGIMPGTELNCLGYPLGLPGNSLGFPILRSGKIASYPLLPTKETKFFLFDFTVFQGNSGGPVYISKANPTINGNPTIGARFYGILGIVTSQTQITERTKTLNQSLEVRTPLVLASVIHASHIIDLIDKLELPMPLKK